MVRGSDLEGIWKCWISPQRRKQEDVGKAITAVPQDGPWLDQCRCSFVLDLLLTRHAHQGWKAANAMQQREEAGHQGRSTRPLKTEPRTHPTREAINQNTHWVLDSVSEGAPGWSKREKGVITENVKVLVLSGVNHSYPEQSFLCRPPKQKPNPLNYFWCNRFCSDQQGSGPIRDNETQTVSLQAEKNTSPLSWRPWSVPSRKIWKDLKYQRGKKKSKWIHFHDYCPAQLHWTHLHMLLNGPNKYEYCTT